MMAEMPRSGQAAWAFTPAASMRAVPSPASATVMRSAPGSAEASARTTAHASPGTALVTTPPEISRITGSAIGALVMQPS